jgi:serine/threonine-protein kinase HipA
MVHVDFNEPGAYSYEQVLQIMKRLGLAQADLEQQVLRAMFNVVGRNNDDHVKNIAFLMNRRGDWGLSPAFDVSYAYNPQGNWTSQHQMSLNGKREAITKEDLFELAKIAGIKTHRAVDLLETVIRAVKTWPESAHEAGVPEKAMRQIETTHLVSLLDE